MTGPLPVVSGRKAIKALQRAGFVIDRIVGSHYVLADPNDPTRAVTVPHHGSKDLKPGTLRSIIRRSRLTVEEFIGLL